MGKPWHHADKLKAHVRDVEEKLAWVQKPAGRDVDEHAGKNPGSFAQLTTSCSEIR